MSRKQDEQFLAHLRRQGLLPDEVPAAAPAARSKWGNRRTSRLVDGQAVWFDSAKEARRYDELLLLYRAGVIGQPLLQVNFPLYVEGVLVCGYRADFVYVDRQAGTLVIEDVKGVRTRRYRVKAKLFFALYGVTIKET